MNQPPPQQTTNGAVETVDGKLCVFYDGYWIRYYKPSPESLSAKKRLIDSLKRRLFHHTEPGINTPGENLEAARDAFNRESDPSRKRVNGTMLAGALFNRATDIFTTVVDLERKGVKISPDNELLTACGEYFKEALELGKTVKHHSGHEGIDELWGEPFKAFVMPIDDFYRSRYIKIAQTMRAMDQIATVVCSLFDAQPGFGGFADLFRRFSMIAKLEAETMRRDAVIFEVWPAFVAAGEAVLKFEPTLSEQVDINEVRRAAEGVRLVGEGKALISYLASVRTPMPLSTSDFLERCFAYEKRKLPTQ